MRSRGCVCSTQHGDRGLYGPSMGCVCSTQHEERGLCVGLPWAVSVACNMTTGDCVWAYHGLCVMTGSCEYDSEA
jgi:hypothetical protein